MSMALFAKVARRYMAELKVPAVNQTAGMCGPASLKSVLGYYGVDVEMEELAEKAGASEGGTSPDQLIKAAKAYGFQARLETDSSFDHLAEYLKNDVPAIVIWWPDTDGHYSVVVDLNDSEIGLMDPETGKKLWVPREEFEHQWFDFPIGDTDHESPINKGALIVEPKK